MSIETLIYALIGWLVGISINHAADKLPRRARLDETPRCCVVRYPAPAGRLERNPGLSQWAAPVPGMRRGPAPPLVVVEVLTPAIFVGLLWRYGPSAHLGLLSLYKRHSNPGHRHRPGAPPHPARRHGPGHLAGHGRCFL